MSDSLKSAELKTVSRDLFKIKIIHRNIFNLCPSCASVEIYMTLRDDKRVTFGYFVCCLTYR